MEKRIVISHRDVMRLRSVMRDTHLMSAMDREHRFELQEELERALVVEDAALPPDVVSIDAKVLLRDVETSLSSVYTVVFPAQADLARGRVSVFAPLGTALLGYRAGDEVEWWMPGGLRRLKIEAVLQADRSPDGPGPKHTERVAA